MSLGDRELPDTNKAVHFATFLIAEQGRGFSQAHRQIPIGAHPVQENLVLERTGHRTQGEAFLGFIVRIPMMNMPSR